MIIEDKPRIIASIEARMGSSRLPGKMLSQIGDKIVIQHLVDRLRECNTLDDIVIATTEKEIDNELVDWAENYGVKCFRGSEDDVLQRVIDANSFMRAEVIVEITGDCPFTDPEVVDIGVSTFLANDCDYLTNCEKVSAVPGLYVQVFRLENLKEIFIGNNNDEGKKNLTLKLLNFIKENFDENSNQDKKQELLIIFLEYFKIKKQ